MRLLIPKKNRASSAMLHYLAYGSNLHPLRLRRRVPSSRLLGQVKLDGYRLAFHKRGQDNSGKCNIVHTKEPLDCIHAAIFQFRADEKSLLDSHEGCGYRSEQIPVSLNGYQFCAFMYLAEPQFIETTLKPFHWYKELVFRGAQFQGFPQTYLDTIAGIDSEEDPETARREEHRCLLAEIRRSEKSDR